MAEDAKDEWELVPATMHRGHWVIQPDDVWIYEDTGAPVADDPERDCGLCGKAGTPEGHDACLGTLPGVRNACCGHGDKCMAYVQFDDGRTIDRDEALEWFRERGVGPEGKG